MAGGSITGPLIEIGVRAQGRDMTPGELGVVGHQGEMLEGEIGGGGFGG